jgi:hypothetical protein
MTAESTRRAVRAFLLVALAVPIVLVAASVALQITLLPQLPDPVAVHWGPSGAPDRFGPAWISPVLTVAVGLGVPVLFTALAVPAIRRDGGGAAARLLGAVAAATAALLAVLAAGTLVMQAGVSDAATGPAVWGALLVALIVTGAVGLGAWFAQPSPPPRTAEPGTVRPVTLRPGERTVWLQRTTIGSGVTVVLVLVVAILAVVTILMALFTEPVVASIMGGATVVMGFAVASTAEFAVRVDASGLTVSSALGWPRIHVPLAEVASARAVTVQPMAEFGGWGVRWAPGRFGVVLRAGEALEVRRRSHGRAVVVTVDDAATGAGLLEAMAHRALG